MSFSFNKGYLYILLTAFIFSTMEIALKMVHGIFDPMQITVLRFLIGGMILVPFAASSLKKRGLCLSRADFRFFMLTGFLCVTLSMVIYQIAITYTTASAVAVVFSGNPVFVTMLAFFILHEQIHKHNVIALLMEICGIIVIINPFNNQISMTGITLTIISALIFSFYSVIGKEKAKAFGSIVVTCCSFLLGSLQLLTIILLGHVAPIASLMSSIGLSIFTGVPLAEGISLSSLPIFIYICAINSALGYYCYMKAMECTSAHEASIVFFLKPIIAPILALIILHEQIPFNMLMGIGFFLAGSLISIIPELVKQRKGI